MGSLMWAFFILTLALLAVSLIWLIWKLRAFSQSQHQTVLDDKLLRTMLGDEALSKDVKQELVRKRSGAAEPQVAEEDTASEEGDEETQP